MEGATAQGDAQGQGAVCHMIVRNSASRSAKSSGKRFLSLSQVKKKQTHTSFSMHFMQQNLVTSLSSTQQRLQTTWSCVWACVTRSHPTCSRIAGRRTGQNTRILPHWAEHWEAACVIHRLVCIPLQAVLPSVNSLAGGRWQHSSRWRWTRHTRMLSRNLGAHGKCLLNYLRSYRKSPVTCTGYLPMQLRWTSSSMSCSVQDVERCGQVNSHLVRTAFSCMHCVQTTRLRSG